MNATFEYLSKHIVALSAAATSMGAILSIVMVTGYLSAFDRSLIWAIEYTDIIKFSLVGVAIFSASIGLLSWTIQDLLTIRKHPAPPKI